MLPLVSYTVMFISFLGACEGHTINRARGSYAIRIEPLLQL